MSETARRLAQKQPPFKKCVTAYSSRQSALKMDGAKLITDTADHPKGCVLGRCSAWAEVLSGDNIDRAEMRIPVVVGSKQSEKLCH